MIHLFFTHISQEEHEFLLQKKLPEFSKDFQNKILKYRRWQDAQLSLLGRMLLNYAFKKIDKQFCENKLAYTSYGKPFFEGENIKFNISHSGNMVVCAITETKEIGIDLEVIQDIHIEDFRSQMTDLEWQRIFSSDNIKASFFDYWTQKEATIKAHGMGLSIPLKSFEIVDNRVELSDDLFLLKKVDLASDYSCHLAVKETDKNKATPIICAQQFLDVRSLIFC
ncbi:4'-phosphopantetheinyl transferase superfamily protein [Aquimarina sp. ERC-38]|uniref:4'-phosphopantetheinyl transferase family protein n=1 Tax=Aquimarina sp. ERC-38 TaxID=2949996 RepID=UPI0022456A64|nr:4'-phosphopantetheinyl transferase superfamily protein [Aquimarina sp. ERC-38]UZO81320.1 4'-phosphopantetheinyl transferase superfamily protein [Aquimarina sp. ERC-38]